MPVLVTAGVTAALTGVVVALAGRRTRAQLSAQVDEVLRRLQQALAGGGKPPEKASGPDVSRDVRAVATRLDALAEELVHKLDRLAGHVPAPASPPAKPAPKPAVSPAPPPPAKPPPAPPPAPVQKPTIPHAAAPPPAAPPKPAPPPPPAAPHAPKGSAPDGSGRRGVETVLADGLLQVKVYFREVKKPEAQELVDVVFSQTKSRTDRVLLDLTDTAYVNSSGLSAITKIAIERDCRLVLTADDVIKVMDLMGFLPLLKICATADEARRSFASA